MSNEPINLNNIPYTQWLEETLHDIIKLPVQGLALNVVLEDGTIYSNYYKISMMTKLAIAGLIQQDAMYNSLAANGLIKAVDEEEDEEEYGEEED